MPRRAGEKVDIPALIKGILNGYPGTSAIFREYLQNSDDAKASSQVITSIFLLVLVLNITFNRRSYLTNEPMAQKLWWIRC